MRGVPSNIENFLRGSLVTFSGALLLGILNYFVRRVLANGLPAKDYGFLFASMSLILLTLAFLDLGLGKASTILQSRYLSEGNAEQSGTIYSLTFWLKLGLGLVTALVFWLLTPFLLTHYFKYEPGGFTFRTLSVSIPLAAAGGVLLATLDAHRAFGAKVVLTCIRSSVVLLSVFLFFTMGFSKGVSMAYIAGPLVVIIVGIPLIRLRHGQSPSLNDLTKASPVLHELFHLSKWVAVSTTGLLAMYNLDTLMLAYFTDMEHVALYNIALPIMQIIQSMMIFPIVFLPIATRMWHQKEIAELRNVCHVVISLMVILLWPITFFFLFNGQLVVTLLFDAKYTGAALAAAILCAAMCVFVICQFLLNVLNAMGRQQVVGKIVLMGVVVNGVANVVLIYFLGIEGAALATCVSYVVIAVAAFIVLHSRINLTLNWRSSVPLFGFGMILTVTAFAVTRSQQLDWPWLLTWSFVFCGIYAGVAGYVQRQALGKVFRWAHESLAARK